jgi:hypothetical protein
MQFLSSIKSPERRRRSRSRDVSTIPTRRLFLRRLQSASPTIARPVVDELKRAVESDAPPPFAAPQPYSAPFKAWLASLEPSQPSQPSQPSIDARAMALLEGDEKMCALTVVAELRAVGARARAARGGASRRGQSVSATVRSAG